MSTDAITATEPEAPTTELLSGAVGDRCANCQAPLGSDQRYCVNCGERRGMPRFSQTGMAAQPETSAGPGSSGPPPQRSRFSSGTTLVAGVATLLLAMGVGVLIGHDSTSSSPTRAPAEVITVGGGGTSSAGAGTTSTGAAASTPGARSGSAKATKGKAPKVVHVSQKAAQAAGKAANNVVGSGGQQNPTVQQGGSCAAGSAGCQNGHFSGNFFGGG